MVCVWFIDLEILSLNLKFWKAPAPKLSPEPVLAVDSPGCINTTLYHFTRRLGFIDFNFIEKRQKP